ncbi:ABC transporter permease [Plantactinospora sp. KBS50]|uniref:ABC transporter permease n=1 Tax=Plantactinospora sp. KBS50 TaxID=2024580 RepID=UPI000BAAACB9|nr:ABC transporter permease [Plantactinospora sp. KBS50]ASW56650.1 ABC transporter permease [Plantactinospora sp. KBS50]
MLRFAVRKVLLAVSTLLAVSVLTFGLFFAAPTNPAELLCGNRKQCSPQQQVAIERRMGLDRPIVTQYAQFMKGIAVGRTFGTGETARRCPAPCLGYSFRNDEPVTDIVGRTLPVTLSIVFGAAVVWLLIGVSIGMVSALRRGTVFDRLAVGTSLVGASMPILLFGPLLLIVFVYEGGLLSYPQYTPITQNPLKWASAMVLPWLALGFLNSASYARLSRAQMLETLSEDFVRTARAKGLAKAQVYGRHALRAAITPIVTIAGLDLGTYLGGTVITETIFGFTGLGKASLNAAVNLDMPLVMATVLLAAVFIVVSNVVVDALYAVIDPRVRLG